MSSSSLGEIFVLAKDGIVFALVAATCLWWNVTGLKAAGSDEIPFRKQTIDLGRSESVTVADSNRDGRLDIVSGENWYEQALPAQKVRGRAGSNTIFVTSVTRMAISRT